MIKACSYTIAAHLKLLCTVPCFTVAFHCCQRNVAAAAGEMSSGTCQCCHSQTKVDKASRMASLHGTASLDGLVQQFLGYTQSRKTKSTELIHRFLGSCGLNHLGNSLRNLGVFLYWCHPTSANQVTMSDICVSLPSGYDVYIAMVYIYICIYIGGP